MPRPTDPDATPWRGLLLLALGHGALGLWAAWAWIHGPFGGEGVVDGAEVLSLATRGSAGAFETKSPLYPALLGWLLEMTGEVPWTVALFGIVSSTAVLLATGLAAHRLGGRRAALVAAGLYALSGSALAFAVQPLPTVFAAGLLVGGVALLLHEREGKWGSRALLGGALLAATVFARFSLLPGALLLIGWGAWRRRSVLVGALGATLALAAVLGARSIPEGGGLNLRLANSGLRSGITDLRPGPRYHRLRWDAVEHASRAEPLPDLDREQYALLGAELAADRFGAAATLLRKTQLFWHGTEIVASADFRHGLERMPLEPVLLWSFFVIGPLALVGLLRRRATPLTLAILGVFAANVLFATCARYRFPALPFCCAAAGLALSVRWTRRDLALLGGALLLAAPNWSGTRLVQPGDGGVQEGYLLLSDGSATDEALRVLEEATRVGDDPRAAYLLGLCHERRWRASGDERELESALAAYRDALRRDPDYPEAAENLVAALLRAGRTAEARATALEWLERIPRAGLLHLNLAGILESEGKAGEAREHAAEGHRLMALRSLSQNELESARRHADAARAFGIQDRRLESAVRGR